jgi:hypothetical protein
MYLQVSRKSSEGQRMAALFLFYLLLYFGGIAV